MAEIVDVSVQYVSDLERGVVGASVPTMIRICRSLNVSCDYILMGQERDEELSMLIGSERIRRLSPRHQLLIGRIMNLMLDALSGKDGKDGEEDKAGNEGKDGNKKNSRKDGSDSKAGNGNENN
jgi:transcriptional regulator with XRE-family HTH domain